MKRVGTGTDQACLFLQAISPQMAGDSARISREGKVRSRHRRRCSGFVTNNSGRVDTSAAFNRAPSTPLPRRRRTRRRLPAGQ